ncbi:phosphoribosylformylglycinamidine synthase subunit PurQ [Brachybacterium sp. JHP9]|uniref:Phosphoribosylformylglycinamidine synthase subunit PurQ n=1 Tax=Brachybacterium equifaecis TaxID=2910770 RepID=A0ABT0QYL5_9MICO|nr:phosphoribosylformylglycinamidine synthase subunit PurQ [Brachybacterium equifaecis]MCL6422758.1 phosphoribosylformylglycinamidine synthase subunit PurQ [Brachybacterium equifaecis]
MRIGVVTFPGSLDDRDAQRAVRLAGAEPVALWHGDEDIADVDAIVLPGGFSYGDYLRAGAISRFAPVMEKVVDAARGGLPVLGICNGFQILCESHLLPGSMIKNAHRSFICRDQPLRVESTRTAWTTEFTEGEIIRVPLKNQDGQYVADARTLEELEGEGRVVFRYTAGATHGPEGFESNPNGSRSDIAGITNAYGNVVGLMPHPEHAVEAGFGPDEPGAGTRTGTDGLRMFTSVLRSMVG